MTEARSRPAGSHDPGQGGAGGEAEGEVSTGTDGRTDGKRPGSGYREIFRRPGALAFSVTAMVGRMPMAMLSLGIVLLVAAITGRYAAAGVVAAAAAVGYAVCAPQFARLTDTLGQHRVLRPQAVAFAVTTAAFITAAELRAPFWLLLLAGLLAGGAMPSLGSMVRARWGTLLAGSGLLHTAFAVESVADEVIFVVGPALVTLLATGVTPAAGLAAAGLAGLTGTLLFAAQRRTQPPALRRARARTQASPAGTRPGTRRTRIRLAGRRPGSRAPAAPAPTGLATLIPVYWCLGAMFGSVDLSTVAFAAEHGHPQLAGPILGLYALGSGVGGLWYGSRAWRAPLHRRFAVTLSLTAAGVATFWCQPGLVSLFLVACVAGLAISPTLIGGYSLIEQQASAGRRTEGMTWLSSAIGVGLATGSPLAGHLVDAHGARWGYVFAAGCGAAAVLGCLAGLGRLGKHAGPAAGLR